MGRHAVEQAGVALPALIGDQRDGVAAPHQLLAQGVGREHVPAGAAGGQDDAPPGHDAPHDRRLRPVAKRLRRVSASTMPMVTASANMDEPP